MSVEDAIAWFISTAVFLGISFHSLIHVFIMNDRSVDTMLLGGISLAALVYSLKMFLRYREDHR
jgi:hypothetical protein